MTDDLTLALALPPPRRSIRKLVIYAGTATALLLVLVAVVVLLIMKVDKFHGAWCKSIGIVCTKAPAVAAAPVLPGGCPNSRMTGSLGARAAGNMNWLVAAEIKGHVSLNGPDATALGDSSVACFGQAFLATFSGMSDGVTYQCMGAFEGSRYAGVCSRSIGGAEDIKGEFVN